MASQITHYLNLVAHGETLGSATAKAFPSQKAKWVKFKAPGSNSGMVYVARDSGVTKAAGTDTTTAGWELDAGQETDWLPIGPTGNLNAWYLIGDGAGDDVLWKCMG